ncbi:hypothetical protein [Phormidium sp. FACHB-1136]|uniref:hypothetical protein n=1 Tax=Phormidium sp. FACHB-1136 TaxID=2692848 RepID=UPI0016840895|nr:hypothetical protein [Phormidium sp. FACHB-1136]MBD2425565.1 hypothetical protein [Phormidium sp. FACHB-1136]
MYPVYPSGQHVLLKVSETEAIDPQTGEHFHLTRKDVGGVGSGFWWLPLLGFLLVLLIG